MIQKAYDTCMPAGGRSVSAARTSSSLLLTNGGFSMAFLLDELSHAVRGGRLSLDIQAWIEELVQGDFEEFYVGDFHEEDQDSTAKKKSSGNSQELQLLSNGLIPTDSSDMALLNGTNPLAPPGELRFNILGSESAVYLKILPLLSSNDTKQCELLPVQCSMFRLMSTLCNAQYGGKGLAEIDAMLDCPLLLPSTQSSDMEMFDDMGATKQWVITAAYYFGTCWIRQLINSFIYAAADEANSTGIAPATAGSFTASSQGFNAEEVEKKIVERLKALVELEEELRFTSSNCYSFAPPGNVHFVVDWVAFVSCRFFYAISRYHFLASPSTRTFLGLDVLAPPKELFNHSNNNDAENMINTNVDTTGMSKEEKKAIAAAKKQATKLAKDKVKTKQKRLKVKQKHEQSLVNRTFGALRPLSPQVCLALGFQELSLLGSTSTQNASQGLSQFQQVTTVGGPVTMLLLQLLHRSLSDSLSDRKKGGAAFKAQLEGGNSSNAIEDDVDNDNPYIASESSTEATTFADIALASCEDSAKKSFDLLDSFLKGGVFASVYEHLAAVTELRCGPNRQGNDDDETEDQLVSTAKCLFSCLEVIMSSELLTRSTPGQVFLAAILKQLTEGSRDRDYGSGDKRSRRPSTAEINKMLGYVTDNTTEIITGKYTGDLDFCMQGVRCMQTIFDCSKRISTIADMKNGDGDDTDGPSLSAKLSEVSDKLLRQSWPDETKMNKSNVGELLSLLVKHSPDKLAKLEFLVDDVLLAVPHLEKGQGVEETFPTCTLQTFGSFFSTTLEYLWKELGSLFDSSEGTKASPDRVFAAMKRMIDLLQKLFNLTKEHDSLAKKPILLQQLKFGSRFIETFVSKAIPYFQVKGRFEQHGETIVEIIKLLQKPSRQLSHIISHGKREKIAILAKEAPRATKANETFIHKVKALLKKNHCFTAMGKCLFLMTLIFTFFATSANTYILCEYSQSQVPNL